MFMGMSPEWAKDATPSQVSEWKEKHGVAQGRVWSREYKVCCPA